MGQKDIWTIGSILQWTEQYFSSKGIESPRLDAEVLLCHVLSKQRIFLYVHFDEPLEQAELTLFREMVKKRVKRMPVAYIVGQKEFMGLTFRVTPDVLVPRPETEILVQEALARLPEDGCCVADIGTGSGAIAVSLAKRVASLHVLAVDISAAALEVAAGNAEAHSVAGRVEFLQGDLLQPLAGRQLAAIISNPPYIESADIGGLAPEVRVHEPRLALDGGSDGLDFYRRLIREGEPLLAGQGFFAFEVGAGQAEAVAALAGTAFEVAVSRDYAGLDRVVILRKK